MAAIFLLCALFCKIFVMVDIFDVIIDLALTVGDTLLDNDFIFIGGLSEVGVDSAELLIGDKDGTCC